MAVLAYIFAGTVHVVFLYCVRLILHLPQLCAITVKTKLIYKLKLLNRIDIKKERRVIGCGVTGGIFTGIKR